MAYDVFISNSSKDRAIAEAACATLEAHGVTCFIASRDILPGQNWGEAIIDAIAASRSIVLIYSAHANSSQQVMREMERAVDRNIPIIPFRTEDVPMSKALEYFISSPHWLDAVTPPLDPHLERLARTVQRLLSIPVTGRPPSASNVALPLDIGERPHSEPARFVDRARRSGGSTPPRRRFAVGAVLVLLLAGVVFAWWFGQARHRQGALVSARLPAAPAAVAERITTPTTSATAETAPPAAVIDLLAMVDPDRDAFSGRWTMRRDGLMSDDAFPASLRVPYRPPAEYDFCVSFTRLSGTDSIAQMLPAGGREIAWVLHPSCHNIAGFEYIKGKNVLDNPTTAKGGPYVTTGRRHRSVVKVRKHHISAFVDGREISSYRTDGSDLGFATFWALDGHSLGVGSANSPTVFHEIQLVEISGKGRAAPRPARLVENLLRDPEFRMLGLKDSPWRARRNPPAKINAGWTENDQGSAAVKLSVTDSTSNSFDCEFLQSRLSVRRDETYTLSFKARASTAIEMDVALQRPPDSNILRFHATPLITEQLQTFTFEVQSDEDCDEAVLAFKVGRKNADVVLQDVQLRRGRVVDLLPLVKPERDALYGKWRVDADGLHTAKSPPPQRLRLPYQPPNEYDLAVDFSAHDWGLYALTLARGNRSFQVILMGGSCGLEMVNGKGMSTIPVSFVPVTGTVRTRRWAVQVRNDAVRVYLDGSPIHQHLTDYSDLDDNQSWTVGNGFLGLGVHENDVVYRKIEIVEFDQRGKPLENSGAARVLDGQ